MHKIKKLIEATIEHQSDIPYLNIKDEYYLWWTTDFWFTMNWNKVNLDLSKEQDVFLLFVLALWWSRTWPWENVAVLCAYIKYKWRKISYWLDEDNTNFEITNSEKSANDAQSKLNNDFKLRKNISFRKDIFKSISILATKWNWIYTKLNEIKSESSAIAFMNYLRSIEWLAWTRKTWEVRMFIKIPLILRELRCQRINTNIPWELCCVIDARVISTAKKLWIKWLNISIWSEDDTINLRNASKIIYEYFWDLYDLPLFAYDDLKDHLNTEDPIDKQNTWNAWEYYIASRLSAENFLTTITLWRAERYDILAMNSKWKTLKISVKTQFKENSKNFPLSKKDESWGSKDFYYAFVKLNEFNKEPDYWFIPSSIVWDVISKAHKTYIWTAGKKWQKRKDSDMRNLHIELTASNSSLYPAEWDNVLKKYYKNINQLELI